ncbi:unnamed protein product [Amoebophrya sp. A25]|nr:unnamed protein product [Amoebophrya sp. A25]|eukprot:GSA25T00026195001.1
MMKTLKTKDSPQSFQLLLELLGSANIFKNINRTWPLCLCNFSFGFIVARASEPEAEEPQLLPSAVLLEAGV